MGSAADQMQEAVMAVGRRVMDSAADAGQIYRERLERLERQISLATDPHDKEALHRQASEAAALLALCVGRSGK